MNFLLVVIGLGMLEAADEFNLDGCEGWNRFDDLVVTCVVDAASEMETERGD